MLTIHTLHSFPLKNLKTKQKKKHPILADGFAAGEISVEECAASVVCGDTCVYHDSGGT